MATRFKVLAVLAGLLLLLPQSGAGISYNSPQNLEGSYDQWTRLVSLGWDAPPMNSNANFTYHVWRDEAFLGTTTALDHSDKPGGLARDPGYLYFVSAAPPGNSDTISLPAVVGVPTISCQVVTVTTSWSYPYLYVNLHQECLGGIVYDKQVVWTAPE